MGSECPCGQPATHRARTFADKMLGRENWQPLCSNHASVSRTLGDEVEEVPNDGE